MDKFHNHWDKLRVFHQVATVGSLKSAAEVLNISQPALSRTINILEEYLGFQLFDRLPRGLRLTRQGEIIFAHTQKIVEELDKAQVQLEEEEDEPAGSLKIGAPSGLASCYLSSMLPEFLDTYPGIKLTICGADSLPNIYEGEADAIISPYIDDEAHLNQTLLTTFTMNLYASPEYIEKYGMPQTVEDLDHHKLLAYGDHKNSHPFSLANWHLGAGLKEGQIRRPHVIINSAKGLITMASKGVGIASFSWEHPALENAGLVEVLPDVRSPTLTAYFVYTNRTKKMKRMKLLEEFLVKAFAERLKKKQDESDGNRRKGYDQEAKLSGISR